MMLIPLRGYLANIVRATSLAQYGRLGNDRWDWANLQQLPSAPAYGVLNAQL